MKKMTLAVFVLSLICFSVLVGCKKAEQPAPEQAPAVTEPAPAEAPAAEPAPADKK